MKKLTVLFLFCLLLTGCKAPVAQENTPRLVTKIQVDTGETYRVYTDSAKIAQVLDYLRFLPKTDPSLLDPELMSSNGITIELTYYYGQNRVYTQKGVYYLSRDKLPYEPIAPEVGNDLLRLLQKLPSDN